MKKYFVICTSTCIKDGKVCNAGDINVYVYGKNNYLKNITNNPDFIPYYEFGYSSLNIAKRYAESEQKHLNEFENRMESEYSYTNHWNYRFTTREIEYA